MATEIGTIKNADKSKDILPRTQFKSIFDKNGNYLDNDLLASDLNKLKGGVVDDFVICTEDEVGVPIPVNADQLEGHPASYFATAESVASLIKSKAISATTDSNGNIDVYTNGDVPTDAVPLYFVQTTTSVDAWIVPFHSINGHPHIHATNWNGTAKGSTAIAGTLFYV